MSKENTTTYEYLGVASNAIVQAINCLTRDEDRYIKECKSAARIATRTCLDRLYSTRDEIVSVMAEMKKVTQ